MRDKSGESTRSDSRSTAALMPPTIQPISGKYLDDFSRYSAEWSVNLGTGSLVRNISAVKKMRISFFRFKI
jgi:hypothetical protein